MHTTYKIIGGDGKEYGPATLDELETWVAEGRVVAGTLVWSSSDERWQTAVGLRELAAKLDAIAVFSGSDRNAAVPAGPWPRLAAFLVDTLVITALANLLWPVVAASLGVEVKPVPSTTTLEEFARFAEDNIPRFLFVQLCRFVAETLFLGRFGATPGKLIAGLRVVRADGTPLGYPRAALRFVARWISEIPLYAGYIPILFRDDRRGLHDLVAGTQVVLSRPSPKLDRLA